MKTAVQDLIVGQKTVQYLTQQAEGLCGREYMHTCNLRHTIDVHMHTITCAKKRPCGSRENVTPETMKVYQMAWIWSHAS